MTIKNSQMTIRSYIYLYNSVNATPRQVELITIKFLFISIFICKLSYIPNLKKYSHNKYITILFSHLHYTCH